MGPLKRVCELDELSLLSMIPHGEEEMHVAVDTNTMVFRQLGTQEALGARLGSEGT